MFIRFISHHSCAGEDGARDELTVECRQYFIKRHADGGIQFNLDGGESGEFTLDKKEAGPWAVAYVMNDRMQTVERYHGPIDEVPFSSRSVLNDRTADEGSCSLG